MSTMRATARFSLVLGGVIALGSIPALGQARWEDVLPQVKLRCNDKWPDNYSMQAYCIKSQHKGWEDVNGNDVPPLGSNVAPSALPSALPRSSPLVAPSQFDGTSEGALIAIVAKYIGLYQSAPNDIIKGGLRPDRGREICRLMAPRNVKNWRGTVYSLSSNHDGNGVLEIDLGGDVIVRTMNNDFSDMDYHTLIPHGTPLFADAAMLLLDSLSCLAARYSTMTLTA